MRTHIVSTFQSQLIKPLRIPKNTCQFSLKVTKYQTAECEDYAVDQITMIMMMNP